MSEGGSWLMLKVEHEHELKTLIENLVGDVNNLTQEVARLRVENTKLNTPPMKRQVRRLPCLAEQSSESIHRFINTKGQW